MSALAQPISAAATTSEAVIVGVEIAAGHDGTAELVISIQYENGVTAPVVLDQDTGLDLMKACGAASLNALIGRSWRDTFRTITLGDA